MLSKTQEKETIFEESDFFAPEEETEPAPAKKDRRPIYIGGAVLLVAAIGGLIYWFYARQFETTDDAFIESDIVQISPRIASYVAKVHVKENQFVKKGDLLVELDAGDFEARLAQAQAQLAVARAQHGRARANVDLTRQTTNAGQLQARSNVETAQTNVQQTRSASAVKQSAVWQAETAVKTAQANLARAQAQIPSAEAAVVLAQADAGRYKELYNRGDISGQRNQQAIAALQAAQAQLNALRKEVEAEQSRVNEANANVAVARNEYQTALAQIELTKSQVNESTGKLQEAQSAPQRIAVDESEVTTADAQIRQVETTAAQAELELGYTKIYAPEDGYVTRRIVQEGQFVQPGTALMAISQSEVWVIANFKETQLERMEIGQPVEIYVDAFPSRTFHGKIESFQAGTGSRFSVLPAENASGNFVKVVQRVPVKIVFDEKPADIQKLFPGMSVQPKVKVRGN